ncbi:MAG: AbrB/MazE/SpoVT family DNA-binding domain-containing protein [Chloroflexota bacterium]
MRELSTVVTRKGQITVPIEIRDALGLRQGDRVTLVLEEGQVRLRKTRSVVDRTAGVLKQDEMPLPAEELRAVAEEAISEDVVARLRQ